MFKSGDSALFLHVGVVMSVSSSGTIGDMVVGVAIDLGYSVYEQSHFKKNGKLHVTVRIDSDNGITHEDCGIYSKALGDIFYENKTIDKYLIETSSPGLQRTIEGISQYKRFIGEPVKVIHVFGDNNVVYQGKLLTAEDNLITVDGESGIKEILMSDIVSANLDY